MRMPDSGEIPCPRTRAGKLISNIPIVNVSDQGWLSPTQLSKRSILFRARKSEDRLRQPLHESIWIYPKGLVLA